MSRENADTAGSPAGAPEAGGCACPGGDPQWLSEEEQQAWLAAAALMLLLPSRLDAQLQRDAGLTLFEYLVLSSLSMRPGETARMSELAKLTNGSLSRLSNVAKRAEQRGWLVREPDPQDGRYTIARLTALGRQRVEQAAPGHVATVRELVIDPLTKTQVRTLAEIGARLREALEF